MDRVLGKPLLGKNLLEEVSAVHLGLLVFGDREIAFDSHFFTLRFE